MDNHVHRNKRLGTWVLINGSWYNAAKLAIEEPQRPRETKTGRSRTRTAGQTLGGTELSINSPFTEIEIKKAESGFYEGYSLPIALIIKRPTRNSMR